MNSEEHNPVTGLWSTFTQTELAWKIEEKPLQDSH